MGDTGFESATVCYRGGTTADRRVVGVARSHPAVLALLAGLITLAGYTNDEPADPEATSGTSATTTEPTETPTATEDATESPYGCYLHTRSERVPPELSNVTFPDNTVVHEVDVRGDNGVLLTGVTDLRFRAAVGQLRQQYSDPPFEIVGEEDVEDGGKAANWTGPSISEHWMVTDISEACPDNTEVRILWTSAGGSI